MAMEKEALTHKIEDDLAARNRNWDKVETHLAENASDDVHGLSAKYLIRRNSQTQSIPNNTFYTVLFDQEVANEGDVFSYNSNTGEFEVLDPKIKAVRITATVAWTPNTAGIRLLRIRNSSGSLPGFVGQVLQNVGSDNFDNKNPIQTVTALVPIGTDKNFQVTVRQTSGGALDLSNQGAVQLEAIY